MPVRCLLILLLSACAASPAAPSAPPSPPAPAAPKIVLHAPGPHATPVAPDETLAQCLKRKGVRLFGAHWCKPCHDQLELFGASAKDVPYTDCQPEGSFGNIPACDALGVDTYPTWIFPDGYRALGTRSLQWLATSADCPLK